MMLLLILKQSNVHYLHVAKDITASVSLADSIWWRPKNSLV